MKTVRYIILAAVAVALTACREEEEKITPRTEPELSYTLPQGTHDYDDRIVEIFERTGSSMVYEFNERELFYTGADPLQKLQLMERNDPAAPAGLDSVTAVGFELTLPDEAYVGDQVELIERQVLDYYSDEFLVAILPRTIYLVDSWIRTDRYIAGGFSSARYDVLHHCFGGPDYVTFSWAGPRIRSMTAQERYYFKSVAHSVLLKRATDRGIVVRSPEFLAATDYSKITVSAGTRLPNGVLGTRYMNGLTGPFGLEGININANDVTTTDWDSYIAWIVSTTEAQREDPADVRGFLAPAKDTAGKVRQKYDIIVRYMLEEYGVDLVKIGNEL